MYYDGLGLIQYLGGSRAQGQPQLPIKGQTSRGYVKFCFKKEKKNSEDDQF